jgi:hypothetical protein
MKAHKQILAGIASIFDLSPQLPKIRHTPHQSDKEALRSDLEQIGKDFKKVIDY